MKIFKYKIIVVLFFVLVLVFFVNDFGIVDIERTAIVTAIGIDKSKGGFEVTAQIAVPKPKGDASSTGSVIVSGTGSTVAYAIRHIGHITGWYPKLSFCNLIVLGSSLYSEDVMTVVNYLEKTLKIQDSALIAGAEKTAKELFSAKSPLDNSSSFALQKILLKEPNTVTDVYPNNLKSFAVDYFSDGATSIIPLIKLNSAKDSNEKGEEGNNENMGASGGGSESSGGGTDSSSGGGSDEEKQDAKVFDASETLVFKNGRLKGKLTSDQTFALNVITHNSSDTFYEVKDLGAESALLDILRSRHNVKLYFKNGKPKLKISGEYFCQLEDQTAVNPDLELAQYTGVPDYVLTKANSDLTEALEQLIDFIKTENCDILRLKKQLYRHHYKHYKEFKDNLLSEIETEINVRFTCVR